MARVIVPTAYFLLLFGALHVSSAMVGGWRRVDENSDTIQNLGRQAVALSASSGNAAYKLRLESIRRAESQIVSGVQYRLTMKVGMTECRTSEPRDVSDCALTQIQKCTVIIWVQSWLNSTRVTSNLCGPFKSVSNATPQGASNSVDAAQPDVQNAAGFAASAIGDLSNRQYSLGNIRVKKAVKQVVAGLMYKMTLVMDLLSCRDKVDRVPIPINTCTTNINTEVVECDVEVWDQAWRNPRYVLVTHQCHAVRDGTLYFNKTPKDPQTIGGDEAELGSYQSFQDFKQKFNKQYTDTADEKMRYKLFQENMKTAKLLESHELGTATYGVTQFADLSPEEFRKYYLTPRWNTATDTRLKPAVIPDDTPTDEFDWRQHNAVTPVKNQGQCGSCWAFSVTGNIEGQWALKKKSLVSLSEQELVDCDKLDEGCNGGLPSNAYQEIQRLGGLENEADYPYKAEDEKCAFIKQDIRVYINGSLNISQNENDMKAWLFKNGPMSIGINAFAMQFYLGGVSHPWRIFCAPDLLDHGVLIVGYGIHKGFFSNTPYWIVKNSWGSYWGESGYYLVYRGDGTCGLNTMVSSAIVN